MITVQIIGGLGNQMFQYAYARALQVKGYDVSIDISAFNTYALHGGYGLNKYNITLDASVHTQCRLTLLDKLLAYTNLHPLITKEKGLQYNPRYLSPKDNHCLIGYFQNEIYFKNIRDILLNEFTINISLSDYTLHLKDKIQKHSGTTVSLHIRRGDYVTNQANQIFSQCSINYYLQAIDYIKKSFTETTFYIFSDDIAWAKENLKIKNSIYVESHSKRLPHEDMYLMSLCRHNIIANSTFSWWGAWMNNNLNKKVIAPARWFEPVKLQKQSDGIVPEDWIRLEN